MTMPAKAWVSTAPLGHVTHAEWAVYCALCAYASANGEAWPRVETLAGDVGMTTRQCRRHLASLAAAGWISRARRGWLWVTTIEAPQEGAQRPHGRAFSAPPGGRSAPPQEGVQRPHRGALSARMGGRSAPGKELSKNYPKNSTERAPRARRTHETLSDLLADQAPDGRTWAERWAADFPELDGHAHRPSVADAAGDAWDHEARKKRTDMPRYVGGWLRREAQRARWSYERDRRTTETDGDAVLRALREEMTRD